MPAQRTVLRNTGVVTQAAANGQKVTFRYTDQKGVQSTRTVTVLGSKTTRHNPDALLVEAQDGLNVRSFRTDRMTHARIVK